MDTHVNRPMVRLVVVLSCKVMLTEFVTLCQTGNLALESYLQRMTALAGISWRVRVFIGPLVEQHPIG